MENEKPVSVGPGDVGQPSRETKFRARAGSGAKFSFYIHLAFYIGVNLLLLAINMMTTPNYWWALWSIVGWGFALLIHAVVSFAITDMWGMRRRMYEKELDRLKDK